MSDRQCRHNRLFDIFDYSSFILLLVLSVPKENCRTDTQEKGICFQLVLLCVCSVLFTYISLVVVGGRLSDVAVDLRFSLSVVVVCYWLSVVEC